MKNDFKYKIIRIILVILFFALIYFVAFNHFDKVLTDEMIDDGIPLLFEFIIFLIFYAIVNYLSIILHELGHLIFGLKSKLQFIAFNIRGFSLVKKDNKIKIEKKPLIKNIGGYCNMRFLDSVKYTKKDFILYFMGGIIVNIMLAIIFSILLLISNNEYLDFLSLLFIINNVYLASYNSIPYCNLVGINTDMRHIINYLHDRDYIKKIGIVEKIINYRENNNSIKNIDQNLLYMPKEFVSDYDLTIAEIYIAYLSEMNEYEKMNDSIQYVLNSVGDTITEAHKNSLKVQEIDYMVHTKIDKDKLKELWDRSFDNYINQMSILSIVGLAIKYLDYKIINVDDNKANDILKQIEKRKEKESNKQDIKEAEQFINDVDNLFNK